MCLRRQDPKRVYIHSAFLILIGSLFNQIECFSICLKVHYDSSPKNLNSVIIYSPIKSFQICMIFFFCGTQLYKKKRFLKRPLTSMEPFHCTKVLYSRKRFFRLLKRSSHEEKKKVILRTVRWTVLWGTKNGSSTVWHCCENPLFGTFIFKGTVQPKMKILSLITSVGHVTLKK